MVASQVLLDRRELCLISSGKDHAGAEGGQLSSCLATESRGRAGQEHRPAGEGIRRRLGPAEQAATNGTSDPREAADDRDLEQVVDDGRGLHRSRSFKLT